MPGTRSAFAERNVSGYYVDIAIDRNQAARYGLNVGDIHDAIMATVGGVDAAVTVEGRERYVVNVRYPRELRDNVSKLNEVVLPAMDGVPDPARPGGDGARRPGADGGARPRAPSR